MKHPIPDWAMRIAGVQDLSLAQSARRQDRMKIRWPDHQTARAWARQQGWPTPWWGFEEKFISRMLADSDSFHRAVAESGVEVLIPRTEYTLTAEKIRELDDLYETQNNTGQPPGWRWLVEELRDIRRAVEAGVVVNIEGASPLRSWQNFYEWAHGRYHRLEEGYDQWIGDDQ